MSDSDQVLELDRGQESPGFDRRSFLRRTALTGVAAGSVGTILSACGSSASSGSSGSADVFGSSPGLQIRVRQPRHDEPVLHPHAVRHRRRLQAARLQLPVDGLGKQQRQPDGQRDQHGHRRESGWDRRRADRPARLQRPDRKGARSRHPGDRLQRRRRRQQPSRLRRSGPETRRRKDGGTDSRKGPVG